MKVLVLLGSPHKRGSSRMLADHFIKGVKENGHTVDVIDIAHSTVHPCLGCDYCGMDGDCVQKDDMYHIKEMIMNHDLLVFVTPLYYFGMSAQLKLMIDRFYSFNGALMNAHKKSVLLSVAYEQSNEAMSDLYRHYLTICRYLHFKNLGSVLGLGCGTVSMTQNSIYPQKAYELGLSIK